MRAWALLVGLCGCGADVVGTWQITRLSVNDTTVDDAGFMDIRSNGDVSSGLPQTFFVRYWWDPTTAAWQPDPTPFVGTASFDVFAFQDAPGDVDLTLEFPTGPDTAERAVFTPDLPDGGTWQLADPDWPHGALLVELTR